MEKRIISKQYLDMDELSKPWETNYNMTSPLSNDMDTCGRKDLINYIKNVKNMITKSNDKGRTLKK